MKVAFVVQRYGLEVNGGAELHCRWVAEHLRKYFEVEVLTTRAADYVTWRNHYPEGVETVNGITVRRFPVARPRHPQRFGRIQEFVFHHEHGEEDELRWLEEEGPLAPALIDYIKGHRDDYDFFIFFSYRYYHSYWGIDAVREKSLLVPTAERDPVTNLRIFHELFRKPRALVYNSPEERAMINALAGNEAVPGDVVGVGTEVPADAAPERFRSRHGVEGEYIIYLGRIDENKGCRRLFDHFLRFKRETGSPVKLLLVGNSILRIPAHPDLLYMGFLPEEDKFDALAGAAALVMPSFYESLSMVTLEAWAMRRPVLANAQCEVLKGQCLRSNGGLFYENDEEFKEALGLLLADARLREILGENGRRYFDANYAWGIIEGKYLALLNSLRGT
ncbi:MAG: glycosyltransferase family 4 protein [Candidatus Aminicenantes bacterium]|nr:glycosyltransferase family 4 protein [Candidatus Aminicenantes bacterium]